MMKQLRLLGTILLCALFTFTFQSCNDDDDEYEGGGENNQIEVPQAVRSAFAKKYADASDVKWEVKKKDYYVAEFTHKAERCEAWFNAAGSWNMTNVNFHENVSKLPKSV
ncbi:lipoprotein, partial [gut metagenome]